MMSPSSSASSVLRLGVEGLVATVFLVAVVFQTPSASFARAAASPDHDRARNDASASALPIVPDLNCEEQSKCGPTRFCNANSVCAPCAECFLLNNTKNDEQCPTWCAAEQLLLEPLACDGTHAACMHVRGSPKNNGYCYLDTEGRAVDEGFCVSCFDCKVFGSTLSGAQCPAHCFEGDNDAATTSGTAMLLSLAQCEEHSNCSEAKYCAAEGQCWDCEDCYDSDTVDGECPQKCLDYYSYGASRKSCEAHADCPAEEYCDDQSECWDCPSCTPEFTVDGACPENCDGFVLEPECEGHGDCNENQYCHKNGECLRCGMLMPEYLPMCKDDESVGDACPEKCSAIPDDVPLYVEPSIALETPCVTHSSCSATEFCSSEEGACASCDQCVASTAVGGVCPEKCDGAGGGATDGNENTGERDDSNDESGATNSEHQDSELGDGELDDGELEDDGEADGGELQDDGEADDGELEDSELQDDGEADDGELEDGELEDGELGDASQKEIGGVEDEVAPGVNGSELADGSHGDIGEPDAVEDEHATHKGEHDSGAGGRLDSGSPPANNELEQGNSCATDRRFFLTVSLLVLSILEVV